MPTTPDPMQATRAITEFLRHARERDLPDAELFQLKATAFSLMADRYDDDGEAFATQAMECRDAAIAARLEAIRRMPLTNPGLRCPSCGGTETENYDIGESLGHNECLTCGVGFPDNLAWPFDAAAPSSMVALDLAEAFDMPSPSGEVEA